MMPQTRTPDQNRRKRKLRSSSTTKERTDTVRKPQGKRKTGAPILPQTPEEFREYEERLRRESCALCPNFKRFSYKDLKHQRFASFNLEKNDGLLKSMKNIFAEYSTDKQGVPVALCYKHYTTVKIHGKKPQSSRFTDDFISSLNAKFKKAPLLRKANKTTPLSKQHIATLTNPSYPLANILDNLPEVSSSESKNEPPAESKSPLKMIETPEKKKPRGKSKKTKSTPQLKTKHIVKAGIESSMSGSQIARHTEALRSQKKHGRHGVKVPAGATARKERTEINKVFWEDFESVPTDLCPDNGAAQMCKDVKELLYKTVMIRGYHPSNVAVMKFNLDGGRGSQKLMAHYIFDDDPILKEGSTEEDREVYGKEHGGLKDTGMRHTLILGLLKGGKESFAVTCFLYNKLVQLRVLERAFPNAEIFLPNDLKQDNLACGIGPHSSRMPLHSNHWSPWADFSDPGTVRTGKSILTDLQRRTDAENEGKDSSAKLFHSVEAEPIDVIKQKPNVPVGDIMCPPSLHLNLGVASHVVEAAEKLDESLCHEWERELGVKREDKRGGKGKDCANSSDIARWL